MTLNQLLSMSEDSSTAAMQNLSNKDLLEALTEEKSRRLVENKLFYYQAYPRQTAFHEAGAIHRERLFMAGEQSRQDHVWGRGTGDAPYGGISAVVEGQALRQAGAGLGSGRDE